jgi:TonB family protein
VVKEIACAALGFVLLATQAAAKDSSKTWISSIPKSNGDYVAAKAEVAFVSDGYTLKGCKVNISSGDILADEQACKTVTFRLSPKPSLASAPVWIHRPVPTGYVPPILTTTQPIFTSEDFPSKALREKQQGTTVLKLDVDEAGMIKKCALAASSGYELLDDAVRKTVCKRATFSPARIDGQPVASHNLTVIKLYLGE